MRRGLPIALAIAALAASGFAAHALLDAPRLAHDESALRFRAGDTLRYAFTDGTEGGFDVRVLAPTRVPGPDLVPVRALPFLVALAGPEPRAWDAYATDLDRGGLAIGVEACLFDATVPCHDAGSATLVTWQACGLQSMFSPLDVIPARALAEDEEILVVDRVKGTTWPVTIHKLDRSRVEVRTGAPSADRVTCGPLERVVVDLRSGRVEEGTSGGVSWRLARVSPGNGPEVRLPGRGPPAALVAPPERERSDPWPPSFDAQGPAGWTLREAWAVAKAQSSELATYLAAHPDAFAVSLHNTTLEAALVNGLVRSRSDTWTMRLLATDGSSLRVDATRERVAGVPRDSVTAQPDSPPSGAPARFRAPERVVAAAERLVERARETGLAPDGELARATLAVAWEREDADFLYLLAADEPTPIANGLGSTLTSYVTLNGDTGRLTDAEIPRDRAREILARYAEGR